MSFFRKRNRLVKVAILLFSISHNLWAGRDIAFPKFQKYLKIKGIKEESSQENRQKILTLLDQLIYEIEANNQAETPAQAFYDYKLKRCHKITFLPRKVCAHFLKRPKTAKNENEPSEQLKLLKFAKKTILSSSETKNDSEFKEMVAKNIIYSFFASTYMQQKMGPKGLLNFLLLRQHTHLPYKNIKEAKKPLSKKELLEEAHFLVDPKVLPERILSKIDLKGMNSEQISHLDVPKEHPLWYQEEEFKTIENPWKKFIERIESKCSSYLTEKKYSEKICKFNEQSKVLFFHKFVDNPGGHHARIKVKDEHGIIWKLKWGNESYTEAIANRLYINIGGKYQDINYSHTIENPIILIINDKKKDENINSLDDLKKALKSSRFHFDLNNYSHPEINEHTLSDKTMLPVTLQAHKKNLESHMGYDFIVLHEVAIELRDRHILLRSGPMSQSLGGLENDRAMRGMHLFNIFTDNFDGKDANTETLLEKINGTEQIVQSPIDLGGAFRGFYSRPRGINGYKTEKFLRKSHLPHFLTYTEPMLYRSKASENATYADLLWMARKITRLTTAQIIESVKASNLPEFIQRTLVYRITARRNHIAKLFNCENELENIKQLQTLNYLENLSNKEQILAASKKYHIRYETIMAAKKELGIEIDYPLIDKLVIDGKIQTCKNSIIINALENDNVLPSGVNNENWNHKKTKKKCNLKKDKFF